MLEALLTLICGVISWLISLLPVGPDITSSFEPYIRNGVGFAKALDPLMSSIYILGGLTVIICFEIFDAGFGWLVWIWRRIRGG